MFRNKMLRDIRPGDVIVIRENGRFVGTVTAVTACRYGVVMTTNPERKMVFEDSDDGTQEVEVLAL